MSLGGVKLDIFDRLGKVSVGWVKLKIISRLGKMSLTWAKLKFLINLEKCLEGLVKVVITKVGRVYRRLSTRAILGHAFQKIPKLVFLALPVQNFMLSAKMTLVL